MWNLWCELCFSARAVDNLSAGEEYTFKLVAVKHSERSAEVTVNSNTSE